MHWEYTIGLYYPQYALTLRVLFEDFRNEFDIELNIDHPMNIVSKELTVRINDYTKADTFDAEVDYKNFPFDPRTIRALGVTVHAQNMEHFVDDLGSPEMITPSDENTIFIGFADEDSIQLNDSSRVVRFTGRDYTGLLIDLPYTGKPLNLALPLLVILELLLSENPATDDIKVENRAGFVLPILAKFAPGFTPLGTTRNRKKNESYWDVIQDLIAKAGLIAYIELDKLVVTKPRALFEKAESKQFVYGRNIKNLEMNRKIGRMKDLNIRVMSMNVEKKTVIKADIPKDATISWLNEIQLKGRHVEVAKVQSDGSIKKETAPFLTFRLPNIADKDQLIAAGEAIFEELGRQQIEGSFDTRDMTVCDHKGPGLHTEFDLMKMRIGTPVEIEIDHDDLTGFRREDSEAAKMKYLTDRCYNPLVARTLAKSAGKFGTPFYTRSAEFAFSAENGFKMKVDFINFVEINNSILGL